MARDDIKLNKLVLSIVKRTYTPTSDRYRHEVFQSSRTT